MRTLLLSITVLFWTCLEAAASIKAGEATVDMGGTTTISLASTYQSTLRSSTISTFRWSTTSPNITITSQTAYSCTIKGQSTGTAQVDYYCSYYINGYYRTMDFYYTVTIKSGTSNLTISPTSITLDEGETYSVTAYQPGYIGGVYFTSNNSSIASVSTGDNSGYYTYGTVTAKSEGTTYIYAKSANGATSPACTVTVRAKTIKPTSIILPATRSVEEGEYTTISASVSPSNATYSLTWTSSDTNIATVTSSGRVYGKKAGTARITAKIDGYSLSDYCMVTVTAKQVLATTISVEGPSEMHIGETYQLYPSYEPSNATVSFIYASDNPEVVSVSTTGLLNAVNSGTAEITVKENVSQLKKSFRVTVSSPKVCAKPTISYVNGKITYACETEEVLFTSSIKNDDVKTYDTAEIDLGLTYTISVYASKSGYRDSEIATATLCWIDQQPSTEGITDEDSVMEVKAYPLMIQTDSGIIRIQGIDNGIETQVYDNNGTMKGSAISIGNQVIINTNLTSGNIALIKIKEKCIKIVIK